MALRRALASASGLKSLAGRTVPFICEKQKEHGWPFRDPRGQRQRGACWGGGLSPLTPSQAAWGQRQGPGHSRQTLHSTERERDRPTQSRASAGQRESGWAAAAGRILPQLLGPRSSRTLAGPGLLPAGAAGLEKAAELLRDARTAFPASGPLLFQVCVWPRLLLIFNISGKFYSFLFYLNMSVL